MKTKAPAGSLPNVEAFCRTYETGSFTKAAAALGVTPQATSRSIARLEATLGVTLFRRTTRSLSPTDAAKRYYERCEQALALLATGEEELAAGKKAPEGVVRFSAPTTYGHHRLLPALGAFRERYPGIRLEIDVSNRNVDFVRDGFDAAIRMGRIADPSLVARSLGQFAVGVYGAPGYLGRFGAPQTPEDLAAHTCIAFRMPSSGRVLPWTFVPGPKSFVPDAAVHCSGDVLATVTLARAGVGLVQVFDFLAEADVARGQLAPVLTSYAGVRRPFSIVYPASTRPTRALRTWIDFVVSSAKR